MENNLKYIPNGTHFYVNIHNIEKLIHEDEKDDDMSHIFRLLNTFVYSIEDFILTNFKNILYLEKLTGGRLHFYTKSNNDVGEVILSVFKYACLLSKEIISFRQFSTIKSVGLQFGADSGPFYEYNFAPGNVLDGYTEITTIGACANFGCKLQISSEKNEILISENVYDSFTSSQKNLFSLIDKKRQHELDKHNQNKIVYSCRYSDLSNNGILDCAKYSHFIDRAREHSNSHPLKDMETINGRNNSNFSNLGKNKNVKMNAAIVFSDIRNFTKKFVPDSDNNYLSRLTKEVLELMYNNCVSFGGTHIQFQGDREFVLFGYDDLEKAIASVLMLSKKIKEINGLSIGIGVSAGNTYLGRVGKDSKFSGICKQPVLIGNVVNQSNRYEEEEALENEIVISTEIYNALPKSLQSLFSFRKSYYVTNKDYDDFLEIKRKTIIEENHNGKYFKPWGTNE